MNTPHPNPAANAGSPGAPARSHRHRIRQALQQQILSGQLRPGNRLRQVDLAKQFGVAQTVVRESLLELQFSGLVTAVDNVGVFVNELDPKALLSAYEVREVLEGFAARLCCERASRRDIQEWRDLAEQIHRCGTENQLVRMGQLDRELHQHMIQVSGNSMLERLTEGYRALGMIVRANRDIDEVRTEHLALIAAIEAGDADAAEDQARAHVRHARCALQRQADAGQFEPAWVIDEAEPEAESVPDAEALGQESGE